MEDLTREQKIARVEQFELITFRNIHGKKAGPQSFGATPDSKTGIFKGIPNYTKKQEEEATDFFLTKRSNIILEDGKELFINEADGVDKAYWDMLKWNSKIQFSYRDAISAKVPFYIEVKELESKEDVTNRRIVNKAITYILNSTHTDLVFRARLLKLDMEEDTTEAIQNMLCDIADKSPQKIIDLYDSGVSAIKMLFYTAKKYNIIDVDAMGHFIYGIHTLGADEESAFMYLKHKDNEILLKRLKDEVDMVTDDMVKADSMFKAKAKVKQELETELIDVTGNDEKPLDLPKNFVQLKKHAVDVVGLSSEKVKECENNAAVIALIQKKIGK